MAASSTVPPDISLARHGKYWEIAVQDRGPGIPVGREEEIFIPFHTSKEKGTGIGLALARSIAEFAGGRLVGRNRPGGGAVFTLSLPVSGR